MLEMIRAELFKASRKKRTWVMIALSSLGSPLLQFISAAFVASRVLGTVADQGTTITTTLEQIASPFNMARNTLAASSTLPFILLTVVAVFAVLLVGEERTFKMWKTILVANPDRMQVLAAKFATGMILLFFVIFGGLIGSLLFGGLAMLLQRRGWQLARVIGDSRAAMVGVGCTIDDGLFDRLVERLARDCRDRHCHRTERARGDYQCLNRLATRAGQRFERAISGRTHSRIDSERATVLPDP
jgi:hypothetical protein